MKRRIISQGCKMLLAFLGGVCFGDNLVSKTFETKLRQSQAEVERLNEYFKLLNSWICVKQKGLSVERWLKEHEYKKVIIYGMKEIGTRLYDELIDTDIEIVCCIDQNKDRVLGDFEVIDLNSEIPCADMVIVTPVYHFAAIKRDLQTKVRCPIISFNVLLESVLVNGCQWK